jgi:hypothetical protein
VTAPPPQNRSPIRCPRVPWADREFERGDAAACAAVSPRSVGSWPAGDSLPVIGRAPLERTTQARSYRTQDRACRVHCGERVRRAYMITYPLPGRSTAIAGIGSARAAILRIEMCDIPHDCG